MADDDYYPPGTPDREIAIRRRVHRIAEFYRHLLVYVIVMSLVWILNVILISTSTRQIKWSSLWAIWPTLGWGVGVLVHGITVLPAWRFFSQEWEDRKVKELMEKERQ
ncbi:MAG: 2TM domain-containing protein [Betaproteobacteria bacterium]|nr:2TM domain-containing protein [Betaproteobacteria bacterium]